MSPELKANPEIRYFHAIESTLPQLRASESSVEVPARAIELANGALQELFPNLFGNIIPVLKAADLIVAPDSVVLDWQHKTGIANTHPKMFELKRKHFPDGGEISFSEKESQPMIQTLPLDGHPIVYPESDFLIANRAVIEAGTARSLIHETFHRIAVLKEPTPITGADDPLLITAFSTERLMRKAAEGAGLRDLARIQRNFTRDLFNFAVSSDTYTLVTGARIMVMTRDGADLKVLTESGYDLNEGIAERLTNLCVPYLVDYLKNNYGEDIAKRIANFFQQMYTSGLSYRYGNTVAGLADYLVRLRLASPEDVIVASSENRIPVLHSGRFPKAEYSL